MKKMRVGKSNLDISPISLGCMSLGTDVKKAQNIVDEALSLGINHFDTADLYDKGRNEEIVGQALQHKRDQIVLTSKVGNHLKPDGSWFWDPSKSYIKEQVKESLKRLSTDYIDIYQLHGGTIDDPIDETIEAFEELVKEGYIRYYGISSIRPNVIKEYIQKSNIVNVMMQYSLLDRRPEEEILDLLDANQISVVTRGSLAKGMLSSNAADILDAKGKDGYLTYNEQQLKKTVNSLQSILEGNQTLNGLALQYTWQHPAVSSAVVGASSIEQLRENVSALEQSFDQTQFAKAKELTLDNKYENHR